MTAATMRGGAVQADPGPFSRLAVLAIVLLGAALFVALLWMIGTGNGLSSTNDGQGHVAGRGLNGFAAMADYLDRRGYRVERARGPDDLARPGLLVLTPPLAVDGAEIDRIVARRRYVGPTLVVVPKWIALQPTPKQKEKARTGWVQLSGMSGPSWPGFLDQVAVDVEEKAKGRPPLGWRGAGLAGALPDGHRVLTGSGTGLVRLVAATDDRYTLAAFLDDGGSYPGLEAIAQDRVLHSGEEDGDEYGEELYPLVVVFEPDLLDNWGMARFENARLAEALVRASGVSPGGTVTFDMTLNGFGAARNLLTLAFTPPFLAATICLLLAAVIAGWRAFLRFGPPLRAERTIAFGKRALVANAAGFIRRARRLHLVGGPYADRARERLVAGLALPRTLDPEHAEAAIDRALAARQPDAEPFTRIAARLRAARRSPELLKAARDLHALERKLIR